MRLCLARYRDPGNFLTLFNPSRQYAYVADERRCYMGDAPALGTVRRAWGDTIAETWIEIQVKDLSEYAGCKDKLSGGQIEDIARTILSQFGYMSVTQLMHFFVRFKAGYYGRFYGAVDCMVITDALQQFRQERYDIICKYEREKAEAEKSAEDARHDAEVRDFRAFLAEHHLSIDVYRTFCEWGITDRDEISELYWLVRL